MPLQLLYREIFKNIKHINMKTLIIFLLATLANYLMGATIYEEFDITKWQLEYEWRAFILVELIIVPCSFILSLFA